MVGALDLSKRVGRAPRGARPRGADLAGAASHLRQDPVRGPQPVVEPAAPGAGASALQREQRGQQRSAGTHPAAPA